MLLTDQFVQEYWYVTICYIIVQLLFRSGKHFCFVDLNVTNILRPSGRDPSDLKYLVDPDHDQNCTDQSQYGKPELHYYTWWHIISFKESLLMFQEWLRSVECVAFSLLTYVICPLMFIQILGRLVASKFIISPKFFITYLAPPYIGGLIVKY